MHMAIKSYGCIQTAYATPTEMINAKNNWKSPKILK
jgi:hypothetical protein